ncbi:hypothetical protein AAH994_15140 [Weeksellaceae bacterium A-14]
MIFVLVNILRIFEIIKSFRSRKIHQNGRTLDRFHNLIIQRKAFFLMGCSSQKGYRIKYGDNVRTLLLKPFDYHIYFLVEEQTITILAILHAKSGEDKIKNI